ncbi:MAG: tetratricopeptide repeat protein [Flavobacteriales bacterium]|nr:tetratricopeptide repeat protein [Flavobacteriales bacterium]
MASAAKRPYEKWRVFSLIGIHLLFVTHFVHWKLAGRTLAPLELNEVLYTVHQGIVTGGFILMAVVMLATLVFGRFFCSWGCHILALQDLSAWILNKLGIRPRPLRSRTLAIIPFILLFYMFVWPQLLAAFHGIPENTLRVVEAGTGKWSSFTTDDLWRNLPPVEVALLTFFVCGGLVVYLLGNRGFCFNGCPYGALFGVADQLAPGRIALTGNCTQCGLCTATCTSDIQVHREIAQHGMVTNPRCLKDLDCVSVCPENAIHFGWRIPPLFQKGHLLGQYEGRYSFSWGEDVAMLAVFAGSIAVLRGLYDAIPLLLSAGLAICLAFFSVLVWRTLTKRNVSLRGSTLRNAGQWTRPGMAVAGLGAMVLLFMLHSAVVQYHTKAGKRIFMQLMESGHAATIDPQQVKEAIVHYEKALHLGLLQPIDLRKELASLYLTDGQQARSMERLTEIASLDPSNIEARFRLGNILAEQGDTAGAHRQWLGMVNEGKVRPHTQDVRLLSMAHLQLGRISDSKGNAAIALASYADAVRIDPEHLEALVALGHAESRTGRNALAIGHFEQAISIGGEHPMLLNNLGALHMKAGDPTKAQPYLERLAQLMPTDARAQYNLGMLYLAKGEAQKAESALQTALRIDPTHVNAGLALKRIRDDRPQRPGAVKRS